MPLLTSELNQMASTEAARLAYMSIHTANPGTGASPTSEASGGSPAYARQALSWGTASGGVISATQVGFNLAANTYTHVGFESAATGGTYYGYAALATAQTLSSQGVIQVTPTLTLTAS